MMLNVLAHPESVLEVGSPKRHTSQNDPAHHSERGPHDCLRIPADAWGHHEALVFSKSANSRWCAVLLV